MGSARGKSGPVRMQYDIIAATSSESPSLPGIHADGYSWPAKHHIQLFLNELAQLQNDDRVDVVSSQNHLSPAMEDAMCTEVGHESPQEELVDGFRKGVYGDTRPAFDSGLTAASESDDGAPSPFDIPDGHLTDFSASDNDDIDEGDAISPQLCSTFGLWAKNILGG